MVTLPMNLQDTKAVLLTLYLILSVPGMVQAQDFSLFEPVEIPSGSTAGQSRPNRESRATAVQPEFTLLGSSRIGDKMSIILSHRGGEKIVIRTAIGSSIAVPDYRGYLVVATEAGKVSLTMPPDSPCIDFPDSGVRCSGEVAELTLPNRPVVASNSRANAVNESSQATDTTDVVEDSGNPFARMRARTLNGDNADQPVVENDAERSRRFTPRRIDPSDVPPGMRVVSTPFGDRLVEQ